MSKSIDLGVNIDHVATLRQARGGRFPSVIDAAELAVVAGAAGITMHLREDRRHIQDQDVRDVLASVRVPVNLEMAVTDEMLGIACELRAPHCCLVPERREELTTEGGLDVAGNSARIRDAAGQLRNNGYRVSLFIDPDVEQVRAAKDTGAPVVELHTGAYSNAEGDGIANELLRLKVAADEAERLGLIVHAGHGLNTHNVGPVARLSQISELNIGHSIVSRAIFIGLDEAIRETLRAMRDARA
ncbi:MAG TPA: pyridoxine 5'-phosphate synthase [Gammaproteobacteria bacterium]